MKMKNQNIQTEIDASYLYGILAIHEEDPNVAEIFRQMMAKHNIPSEPFPASSGRA